MPPFYSFLCPECDATTDALVRMEDRDCLFAAPTCTHRIPGVRGLTAVPMRRVKFAKAPAVIVRNPAVPRRSRG